MLILFLIARFTAIISIVLKTVNIVSGRYLMLDMRNGVFIIIVILNFRFINTSLVRY